MGVPSPNILERKPQYIVPQAPSPLIFSASNKARYQLNKLAWPTLQPGWENEKYCWIDGVIFLVVWLSPNHVNIPVAYFKLDGVAALVAVKPAFAPNDSTNRLAFPLWPATLYWSNGQVAESSSSGLYSGLLKMKSQKVWEDNSQKISKLLELTHSQLADFLQFQQSINLSVAENWNSFGKCRTLLELTVFQVRAVSQICQ